MKIYLNRPRYHWISPYTMAEKICFWRKIDYDEPWVELFNKIFQPVSSAIRKVLDLVHPEINYVKIDPWDTWSMDHTLAPIILPMLKQLQKTKHGAPNVADSDVPKHLGIRSTDARPKEHTWDTDEFHFQRWDWVLDELIWTFEQLVDKDNDAQFWSGEFDLDTEPSNWDENGKVTMYQMVHGPKHTAKFDARAWAKHEKRISRGLQLFGKYFRALWD